MFLNCQHAVQCFVVSKQTQYTANMSKHAIIPLKKLIPLSKHKMPFVGIIVSFMKSDFVLSVFMSYYC